MPLYDFRCRACGHEFEALVRPGHEPGCPACASADLERLLSSFAVSYKEKTQAAAKSKRQKQATQAHRDNIAMEREIEEHRREDH
ncbi:MAG: zinc ribbon domain-containing protein [Vicinamibacterales bacterium]